MKATIARFRILLEEIASLLTKSGELEWADIFQRIASECEGGPIDAKREVLSLYGGMGSFNDLFLYKE